MAQTIKRSKKKWLEFDPILDSKGKLKQVLVSNKESGCDLGHIEYYNGWRQYIMVHKDFTQFSAGCHRELADYIDKLNWTKGCYKMDTKKMLKKIEYPFSSLNKS